MSHRIGAFTLTRPLGQGVQGTVWEATHAYTQDSVAIKVLHPDAGAHYHRLEQEAQAMARLAHPGVVAVLDVGQVGAAEASAATPAGSPWLAMELIRGAAPLRPARQWDEALHALLALLDALAHCHARGVVHRDLKPANVLVRDGRVCVTDFGLAWLGDDRDARLRAGTPNTMAPEQFLGRPVGPPTDLYALGCLACVLVQGAPPFQADSVVGLRDLHLRGVPTPAPVIPVPDGFGAWVTRLLAKQPIDRYRSAAAAADALTALGPARSAPSTPSQPSVDELTWVTALPHSVVLDPLRGRSLAVSAAPRDAPRPVPPSWRSPYPVALDDIHRSGFGLHALREPPLIGRDAARDRLWSALRDVAADGVGRVIHVVGPPGIGRQALIRWLHTRAAELDVVSPAGGLPPHLREGDAPAPGALTLCRCEVAPPGAAVVELGPLHEAEIRRLIDHRVHLDPLLTARLAWSADGHPGRAVAALAAVVPRLVHGPDGLDLPRDADLGPPRDPGAAGDPLSVAWQAADWPQVEALVDRALDAPHLPLTAPARAIGLADALRWAVARQGRPAEDPARWRADVVEAWILANLHLRDRAAAIAKSVLRRPSATPIQRRDAHLVLGKTLVSADPEQRLRHLLAAEEGPPSPIPANRLRQWRSLLVVFRELRADAEIDRALDRIAADDALRDWADIERFHEAQRRGQPADVAPLLARAAAATDPELIKAFAGLAFATGRHADGERLLRGLLDRGFDSALVRCNLGWIIASQGRLAEVPPLIDGIIEADADVLSSLALLKAYVHAADPQIDADAYLSRFEPSTITPTFRAHTCQLLDDLAARADAAGLIGRSILARRHASWLRRQAR